MRERRLKKNMEEYMKEEKKSAEEGKERRTSLKKR
jgi:hypothetical protein